MNRKEETILELCALLAEQEHLTVTVSESAKGAGIIGISALLGGLFGGKNGLLIGGAIGTTASFLMASDFKSVPDIIREDMTPAQRKILYKRVNTLLQGVLITDAASALLYLSKDTRLKTNIISVVKDYFTNGMGLQIK